MSTATSSRVKAVCSCGKKYLVRAEFAGQRSKCPCGKYFSVPPQEDSEVPAPEKKCPWCGVSIGTDESACETCEHEANRQATRGTSDAWWTQKKNQNIGTICAITAILAGIFQTQLDGPGFIWFYVVMGIACCIGFVVARLTACSAVVFIMLLVAFEAIGAIRYGYGLTQGMHKFAILAMMMLFGPLVIAAIAFLDQFADTSSGGWSTWGCSGGSSCGSSCGGGCGGGGCGGCGS